MSMPTPDDVPTTTNTAEAADDADGEAKAAIKQFGPSQDAEGNTVPTPMPVGVDLAVLGNAIYANLSSELAKLGITDVESFVDDVEAVDKTKFPGNKHGRVSYNFGRTVATIFKNWATFNKERGIGGTGALKKKLEEKETRINELEKKMAELIARLGG